MSNHQLQVIDRPQATLHLRNLSQIKQDLYVLEISLTGTSASTSIRWESLGFSGEELAQIKASEAKLANIPLFKALKAAGLQLTTARDRIYSKMLRAEGRTACTQEKLPEIWAQVEHLKVLARELRFDLVAEYEAGSQEFTSRITHLLASKKFGLTSEEVSDKVARLSAKFPDRTQLEEYLQVKITAFELIPSIESQLSVETSIASAEAQKLAAQNKANAERVIAQIQAQQARDVQKLRQELIAGARSECYEMIAKLVTSLSKYEVGSTSKRLKANLKNQAERLEALLGVDIDGTLGEVFNKLTLVSETVSSAAGDWAERSAGGNRALDRKEQLQAQIDELKASLIADQEKLLAGSNNFSLGKSTIMNLDLSLT